MMAQSESIGKAEAAFQQTLAFVTGAIEAGNLRADEVERSLFQSLLRVGQHLLQGFLDAAGDGDHGETVEHQGHTLRRSEKKKTKPYRSIFGVLSVARYVYAPGPKKRATWLPVDAKLGLPAEEQSYVLEDWLQRLCVKESFQEGVQSLRDLLGVTTSVRAAEVMNRAMAEHAERFSVTQAPADPSAEEALLVVTADGKGVPMRRPLEERLQAHRAASACEQAACTPEQAAPADGPDSPPSAKPKRKRLKRGEKRTRKQMAYVGAVYSIAPFVRTAEHVVEEVCRQERQAERPRPKNKQVFAEMTHFREGEVVHGQERCFARLALAAVLRLSMATTLICLMDGQRSLWALKESWFSRAVGILDLFHVMERLWQVAHAFHGEGSDAAERQVSQHLRLMLEGKVGYVIGLYKRMLTERHLKGARATTVREAITYFENNKQYMKYNEYLAKGYPIGTGVVEGACRHFVKDRMELAGMRWEIEGAQAMLSLRALYLNDQWDDFVEYRIQTEQETLYAQAA